MSFADEFPNDNPELFVVRLPTAAHLHACAPSGAPSANDLAGARSAPLAVAAVIVPALAVEAVALEAVGVEAVGVEAVALDAGALEAVALDAVALDAVAVTPADIEPADIEPADVEPAEIEVVDAFDDADFEGATLESIPPPPDCVSVWEETLRDVALAHGATPDAAATIAEQLASDPVARTWRTLIMGGDADFSACGAETLDEWSAHLVTRVVKAESSFESIRRELRGRGVCAFGLVVEAA